jgi:hypothetical protein
MNNYPNVTLQVGADYDEDAQQGSFMNATLQSAGVNIAFSVAATVLVPGGIVALGIQVVADFLNESLNAAAMASDGISFTVQVGPSRDAVSFEK